MHLYAHRNVVQIARLSSTQIASAKLYVIRSLCPEFDFEIERETVVSLPLSLSLIELNDEIIAEAKKRQTLVNCANYNQRSLLSLVTHRY